MHDCFHLPTDPCRTEASIVGGTSAGTDELLVEPLLALAPARKPEFKIQTLPLSARLRPPTAPPMIPAGVYKTVPYSCIVVVPGPQPDDRCVINPGDVASAMPIVRPDLRFIPLDPAKK